MSGKFKYPDNSQSFCDSQQSEELSNSPDIVSVTPTLRAGGVLVTRGVQHLTQGYLLQVCCGRYIIDQLVTAAVTVVTAPAHHENELVISGAPGLEID